MTWFELVAPFLFVVALLILPGLLIALAAGRRGFAAAALAPALSITAISVGAIVGEMVGVPWGWWTSLSFGILLAGLTWGVRRLLNRWLLPVDTDSSLRSSWPYWAGAATGMVLWLRHLGNVFGRPDAFSQTFDNVYHLSLVRLMATKGTGSSITEGGLNPGSGPWFYPAAFHDIASTTLLVFPDSIEVALNATVWVLVAIAWPLGCLYLFSTLVRSTPAVTIGVGVLTASLTGFPLLFLEFGVLYPNLTGLILLPSVLGLVVEALGLGHSSQFDIRALLVGALTIPGVFLSHPSVILTLFAIATPMLLVRIVREIGAVRRREIDTRLGVIRAALMFACLPVFGVIWLLARPWEAPWVPLLSRTDAFGQAMLNAPLGVGPAWIVSILMALGIVAAWNRRQTWLIGAWGVTVCLWLVAASGPAGPIRDFLTGPYYNDPYRLATLFTIMAIPLAAIGLDAIVKWATTRVATGLPRIRMATVSTGVGVLAVAVLLSTTQRVPYMNEAIERAATTYVLTDDVRLVTTDEYTLIHRAPEHIESDAVVATNPWTGASLLYAFTGIQTTTKHIFYDSTPELDLLNRHLDDAAVLSRVCQVAQDLGVRYALDFGTQEVHYERHPYPGLEDFATNPGFTEIDREGDVALYRIDICWDDMASQDAQSDGLG